MKSAAVKIASTGISRVSKSVSTIVGAIVPEIPTTIVVLNRFEPITLPNASACSFFFTAAMHEASSGSDVPIATIVSPIMRSLTPSACAISTPPQTSNLELSTRKISPVIRKT